MNAQYCHRSAAVTNRHRLRTGPEADIDRTTVSLLEGGKRQPTLGTMLQLKAGP
jgi:hypothetical protein